MQIILNVNALRDKPDILKHKEHPRQKAKEHNRFRQQHRVLFNLHFLQDLLLPVCALCANSFPNSVRLSKHTIKLACILRLVDHHRIFRDHRVEPILVLANSQRACKNV